MNEAPNILQELYPCLEAERRTDEHEEGCEICKLWWYWSDSRVSCSEYNELYTRRREVCARDADADWAWWDLEDDLANLEKSIDRQCRYKLFGNEEEVIMSFDEIIRILKRNRYK